MTGGPRPQQVVAASLPGRGELHEWLPDVGHVSQGVALLNCYEEPATFSRSGPAYLGPRSLARPPRDMASSGGKTPILDLTKYLDRRVRVKFQGGREVEGALKGYDQLVNLVLDDTFESTRDPDDPFKASGATRKLGLVICRGVQVCLITPVDGTEEIANPFVAGDGGS